MCATVCTEGGRFLISSHFPAPGDYVGPYGELGRGILTIEAYLTSSRSLDCERVGEEGHFYDYGQGIVQNIMQCSDGSLAWWTVDAYAYVVKVAGHDSRNVGLAKLVAHAVVLTGP